jgi:hypothetical protein
VQAPSIERPNALAPAPQPAPTEADSIVLQALHARRLMNLEWGDDTTLSAAITYLRTVTGLNFFVTPLASAEMEDRAVPLTVDNVEVATVLDIVTEQHGLAWEVRDGLVRIGLRAELASMLRLRFFDVHDLVGGALPFDVQAKGPSAAEETLRRTIVTTIDPSAWAEGGATIEVKRGVLIVRATAATYEKVGAYLDGLRPRKVPHFESR